MRESEAKFRTVFESIDEGFLIHEVIRDEAGRAVDYRLLEINPAHTRMTGLPRDMVGKLGSEFMPDVESYWLDIFDRVARTGVSERAEKYNQPTGRWYNVQVSRVAGHDSRIAIVFDDVTARKRAELALKASEEKQTFLLKLSDALRPLGDAADIQFTAVRMLGKHLGANRVAYAYHVNDETFEVTENYVDGASAVSGRMRYADYGSDILSMLQSGQGRVQPDVQNDERLTDAEKKALADASVGASLNVPLMKNGGLVAFIGANYADAHAFDERETDLVQEVAERTWSAVERGRAEEALRASEKRQAFLLKLSDALRPLADPVAVQAQACRVIGEHLGVDRAYYAEIDEPRGIVQVRRDYLRGDSPSMAGTYRLVDYGWSLPIMRAGQIIVIADVDHTPLVPVPDRPALKKIDIVAHVAVPVVKEGSLVGCFCVSEPVPREWRQDEVELIRETGERT